MLAAFHAVLEKLGLPRKRIHDLRHTYTVELIPTVPEGYSVHVPALPGVVTDGGNVEEALAMAREAITLHLEACARTVSKSRSSRRVVGVAPFRLSSRFTPEPVRPTPYHSEKDG